MIQRLEGEPGAHGAIADDGDHAPLLAELRGADRHAERRADRSARVPHAERVEDAFRARGERRQAAFLLDGVQTLAPPGEHLVRIGLVAHVPHDAIDRRVEYVMQGDGELDRAEPGREVAAARRDGLDEEFAQLARQLGQLARRELAQVGGRTDRVEQRIGRGRVAAPRDRSPWGRWP